MQRRRYPHLLPIVLLVLLVAVTRGQVLNGIVRSVSTFDTCTNSPLATDPSLARRVVPTIENQLTGMPDKTPCGILGESTPITAVTVFLETNEVAGGDNLVFSIPSIPNDPTGTSGEAGDCAGTLEGTDCQVLAQPLVITFESSNAVLSYSLIKTVRPIPYAMVWEESENAAFPGDGTPGTNSPYRTFSSAESCSALLSQNSMPDVANPFRSAPNAGPVGRSQQRSVCPTQDALAQAANTLRFEGAAKYFPDYDYFEINPTCNILACPTTDEDGDYVWKYGYLAALEPVCSAFRIQESPRTLINVEVKLGQGTDATDFTQTGQLTMSSLQDGALVPDTSGTVLAAIVTIASPIGFVGQPLSGGIITCGTCVQPAEGDTEAPPCTYGLLSDITPDSVSEDGSLIQTRNPWTNTQGGLDATCANNDGEECDPCNIPTQACRRILLQDPTAQGSWYYVTEDEWVRSFGSGCSKNGMATDIFITRPEVAELMCAGDQGGTCVPGYQQVTLGDDFTSTTPCENFLVQAQQLFAQAEGAKVSFAGVPLDYNQVTPPYWMDKLRLLRDPTSSGTIQIEVELYLSADYVGEAVSVSTGSLLGSTILCSAPQNNAAGEVFANVQNTGATAGSYRVEANFGTAGEIDSVTGETSFVPLDGGTTVVTQVTDCTISLEPLQIGACTIPFTYAGPIDPDLVVALTLYSGTVVAGRGPVELSSIDVQCFITSETGGGQTFGTVDFTDFVGDRFDTPEDDDDDGNDTCYFWQIWPWPNYCTPDTVKDWMARILFWCLMLFWTAVVLGIVIYSCMSLCTMNSIRKLQKKLSSKSANTISTASTSLLATSMLFLCLVCSADASSSSPPPSPLSPTITTMRNSNGGESFSFSSESSGYSTEGLGVWNVIIGNMGVLAFFAVLNVLVMGVVISAVRATDWWKALREQAFSLATMRMTIRSGGGAILPTLVAVSLLACCSSVHGQVNILSVSSFRECVFTGNSSTGLNCGASEFATTIDLEIFTPSGTSADNVSTATFNVDLTTVPNQNSDEQQLGSGIRCPAESEDQCQTTTPAQITVTASESVLIYEMQDITGTDEGEFFIPYNYYYVPVATVVGTTDDAFSGAAEDLLDSSTYHNVQCQFLSSYYSTGEVDLGGQSTIDTRTFTTKILNDQQLRCPTTAQPPFNPPTQQKAEGALHYEFSCTYTRNTAQCQSGGCQVNLEYSAVFEPLGPFCRVYALTNPPSLGVNIEVSITTPFTTETLQLQSVTIGADGATGVSEPNRLVSATILGPLTPDGLIGPDLQGYIVVCNGDEENPGVLNMVPDTVQQTSGTFDTDSLAFNPWNERPQTPGTDTCPFTGEDYPKYPTPEPCGLSFLFPDDPWAMFYYVPPSLTPTYGRQCGQNGVDPALYQHPTPQLQFNSLLRANGATLPVQQLIPSTQCIGSGVDEVCGLGEISNVFTCVPGFGIGYLDLDTETPCNKMATFRDSSATMADLDQTEGPNAAQSFLVPDVPLQWDNANPIHWIRNRGFFYKPPGGSTGYEMLVTVAGQLVDYPQTVTNGELETGGAGGSFCTLNVTGTAFSGAAYYKVCNQDRLRTVGNYNLAVECGYVSDYDQATDSFSEASVLVSPASLLLSDVQAGTCVTAATVAPFLLEFLGSTTGGNSSSEAPIQCNYKLFSADTLNPSDVLLSETAVVCQTTFTPTFVLGNETLTVPDTLTGVIDPSDVIPSNNDTDTDSDGLSTVGEIAVWTLVIGFILGALLLGCCICCGSIVQKNKTKKLLDPQN